jgi:hypothetical protein
MVEVAKRVPGFTQKGLSFYSRLWVHKDLKAIYGSSELSVPLGRVSQWRWRSEQRSEDQPHDKNAGGHNGHEDGNQA